MGQMQGRDAPSGQDEPGGQLPHDNDLSAAENVPALHSSHDTASEWEKLPALHGIWAGEPGSGQ